MYSCIHVALNIRWKGVTISNKLLCDDNMHPFIHCVFPLGHVRLPHVLSPFGFAVSVFITLAQHPSLVYRIGVFTFVENRSISN